MVQANLLAALTKNSNAVNKVYNIGCGQETTLIQLLSMLEKDIHPSITCKKVYRENRVGDIKISSADISNAQNYLNFNPVIPLAIGLTSTVEYYKQLEFEITI